MKFSFFPNEAKTITFWGFPKNGISLSIYATAVASGFFKNPLSLKFKFGFLSPILCLNFFASNSLVLLVEDVLQFAC